MRNVVWHILYGNDMPSWAVAGSRALVTAVGTGLLSWIAVWTAGAEVQAQVAAGLVPFIGIIVARFGLEGAVDASKERRK
jgi:hypothetical protein